MVYTMDRFEKVFNSFPIWNSPKKDIIIIQSPVTNCQHFSIGGAEWMINQGKEEFRQQVREIKKIFRYPNQERYNMIIDISIRHEQLLKSYLDKPEESLLSNSRYTSTNGNIRHLILLNLAEFK